MRRQGMAYRVHDFGPLTIGLDPLGRSGESVPVLFVIFRHRQKRKDMTGWGPGCEHFVTYHRWSLQVSPKWSTVYRLRRYGLLRPYTLWQRLVWKIAR